MGEEDKERETETTGTGTGKGGFSYCATCHSGGDLPGFMHHGPGLP